MTARRSVLVICDGLRANLLSAELTPTLWGLKASASQVLDYRSSFPSLTRVCSATIATGCRPANHGLSGNVVALDEGQGLEVASVGKPDFRDRMRRALGRTLARPTLAERLVPHGGAILFSNVSAGAAYMHDPDGHGFVYHRSGSFAPGLAAITGANHLAVSHDAAGDRAMTERFCAEVLTQRRPAHATLWLAEPDLTGHLDGLGSPAYRVAMGAADWCVGRVIQTLASLDPTWSETLLLVGSDHGMETIRRIIPVEERLVAAGHKASLESKDVVVAPNGSAALIYLADQAAGRAGVIADWLRAQDWVDEVLTGAHMAAVGPAPAHGLAIAFSLRHTDEANAHGVPGLTDVALDPDDPKQHPGGATHGGLGLNEQRPFLFLRGGGFRPGGAIQGPASLIDIAPTILAHHGLVLDGMDGRPLVNAPGSG
jgi:Type I phosphodiesterase / nucleotide pyrophosphatase